MSLVYVEIMSLVYADRKYRTLREKGLCGFSWEGCWGTEDTSDALVGVAPEDPEVTGVGGPTDSAGLSPPDVDEEGDLTLPCNQPNQRALLSTQSPPPNCHQITIKHRAVECLPTARSVCYKIFFASAIQYQSPFRVWIRKSYLMKTIIDLN